MTAFPDVADAAKPATYTHWAPGYPSGSETEDCAVLTVGGGQGTRDDLPYGFWTDVDCNNDPEMFAICEKVP